MKSANLVMGLTIALLTTTAYEASATSVNTNTSAKGIINFDVLDTDHNGTLSAAELNASSRFKGDSFTDIDANGDGMVNGEELSNWSRKEGKGNAVGSTGVNGSVVVPGTNARGTVGVNGSVNGTINGVPRATGTVNTRSSTNPVTSNTGTVNTRGTGSTTSSGSGFTPSGTVSGSGSATGTGSGSGFTPTGAGQSGASGTTGSGSVSGNASSGGSSK